MFYDVLLLKMLYQDMFEDNKYISGHFFEQELPLYPIQLNDKNQLNQLHMIHLEFE